MSSRKSIGHNNGPETVFSYRDTRGVCIDGPSTQTETITLVDFRPRISYEMCRCATCLCATCWIVMSLATTHPYTTPRKRNLLFPSGYAQKNPSTRFPRLPFAANVTVRITIRPLEGAVHQAMILLLHVTTAGTSAPAAAGTTASDVVVVETHAH